MGRLRAGRRGRRRRCFKSVSEHRGAAGGAPGVCGSSPNTNAGRAAPAGGNKKKHHHVSRPAAVVPINLFLLFSFLPPSRMAVSSFLTYLMAAPSTDARGRGSSSSSARSVRRAGGLAYCCLVVMSRGVCLSTGGAMLNNGDGDCCWLLLVATPLQLLHRKVPLSSSPLLQLLSQPLPPLLLQLSLISPTLRESAAPAPAQSSASGVAPPRPPGGQPTGRSLHRLGGPRLQTKAFSPPRSRRARRSASVSRRRALWSQRRAAPPWR